MKTTSLKRHALLLGLLLSSTALHSHAQLFDYDDANQWSDLYRTGTNIWTRTETGGVSDTPWATNGTPNNSIPGFQVVNQTFSTSADSFTIGINFFWKSMTGTPAAASGTGLVLGFGSSASPEVQFIPRFNGNDAGDPLGDATAQQLHIGFGTTTTSNQIRVIGGGVTDNKRIYFGGGAGASTAILSEDSWYYMEATFARGVINTTFDITLDVYESSASGVRGSNILTQTYNQTNIALLDADVHAFLGGVSQRFSNIGGVDNFAAPIPEPGSAALVLGGLTIASIYRIRSQAR